MQQNLFTYAPTAMLLIDPIDNKILQSNQLAAQMFQFDSTNLAKYTVSQFFLGCLEKLHNFTLQVMESGQAWCSELFIQIGQQNIHLEINARYLKPHILLSCEDSKVGFALRHKSAAELHYQEGYSKWNDKETVFEEMERHNQLLLSAVGDGIYGVDTNGCTTFFNSAAEHILGWQKSELAGLKIHEIIHHKHDDGSYYPDHQCPIYAAFNDGIIHSVENEVFWSKDGRPIPVEYTSTPITDEGMLVGAVVIFRDITERKRTQEKLLSALDEVASLKQKLEVENAYLLEELSADFNHHQIIGQSAAVQRLVNQIELVGPTNANVLIIGESGTGKELIARAIHDVSDRKSRPLIRVNCAAIPTELFESEFFGHVKGAFSGAIADRIGRFELADGGTLFLDEIGEMPLHLQGKLLRVLQERQFERVGDSVTRKVDVRVIAATNRNLTQLIAEQTFREDLYFRLNVFPIHSPPLRERLDDIPLLLSHLITKLCQRFNQPKPSISMQQIKHLQSYDWPGNIRELENIIERQVILAKGGKLNFELKANQPAMKTDQVQPTQPAVITKLEQQNMEINNIRQALLQCNGKIYGEDGAANLLGLKPTTLSSKIKKYGISKPHT
ncbi:sigma 54-interacting transcriptional regulator [Marinomonas sp. CT5]|uniref:sigma-54 interaction domain-containing protein n=1 Tax=Marinomonas sp. CT5 TaxID=2066133 RepID=UPI001BAEB8A6|nr:sigma 54-interacting transcriptional regulator [Marinomonas sp. CT5]